MRKLSDKNFYLFFIILFISLNLLNGFVVSLPFLNIGLNVYKFTPQAIFTSILGDLGFLLILLGIVLLTSNRKKTVILNLTLVTIFLSTVVFLLKIYSFYYGTAFSFFNIRTFSNSNPDLGKQLTIHLWKNLISMGQYIAVFPALILIYFTIFAYIDGRFPTNVFAKDVKINSHLKFVKVFNVLILGLSFYSLSIFTFQYKVEASLNDYIVEDLEAIQNMGVYTYLTNDLFSYLSVGEKDIIDLDEEIIERAKYFLEERENKDAINFFGELTNNTEAIFEDKTLVILQLESFNTYLLNLVVEDPLTNETYEITPFLNSIVNDPTNLFYKNFFSNIGVGKTTDAEFAALTGIIPDGNIVTYFDYIHEDYETLPKLFTQKGYETYALRGSNKDFYRREDVYPLLGFNPDNLVSEESLIKEGRMDPENPEHKMNGWVNDNIIYDKLIDFLDKDKKQFVFALSTILHSPFTKHELITGFNGWTHFIKGQIGRYLDYARYTDNALKRMFEILEEKDLLEDIVFIMYGDHKSDLSLREHSKLLPEANDLLTNQKISHNVPLIITSKGSDLSPYQNSTSLVRGQADIKRTVSNLFGLNEKYSFGVDALTTDKTVAYVPLTMDIFTDEFQLNYRDLNVDNFNITDDDIETFITMFDSQKTLNDLILHHNLFKEPKDEP